MANNMMDFCNPGDTCRTVKQPCPEAVVERRGIVDGDDIVYTLSTQLFSFAQNPERLIPKTTGGGVEENVREDGVTDTSTTRPRANHINPPPVLPQLLQCRIERPLLPGSERPIAGDHQKIHHSTVAESHGFPLRKMA